MDRIRRRLVGVGRRPFTLLLLLAVGLTAGLAGRALRPAASVAVPLPVYEIEASSGSHRATLAGLPVAPVGALAVPVPVDANGDLLPDVTVTVGLVETGAVLDDPPDLSDVIAPSLRIDRILPGAPLAAVPLPLRIAVKLTVLDDEGLLQPTFVRLGYETGDGGSIPGRFALVATGLLEFFNPLRAEISTVAYEGPLTMVAGIERGPERVDADVRFAPLPAPLVFTYGSDTAGSHVGVHHGGAPGATLADREVDLDATLVATGTGAPTRIHARVERLPRSVEATVRPGQDGSGGFDLVAQSDGRLPDLAAEIEGEGAGGEPLLADLDVDGFPSELHGSWALPDDGPASVRLDAPREAIGAVDVRVANAHAPGVPAYVPTQRQFVALQRAGGQRVVSGHVEGIRLVDVRETEQGLDAHVSTAGLGRPLEVHGALDGIGDDGLRLEATATVDPLPSDVTVAVDGVGGDEEPLRVAYTSSDSVDVDGHVELRTPEAGPTVPCGDPGTLCGTLSVRHIPTRIETRLARSQDPQGRRHLRLDVDSEPRVGGADTDVVADVVVGRDATSGPLVAHGALRSIPDRVRVRTVEDAAGSTELLEFRACERDEGAPRCGEATGEIGSLEFSLRNFLARPPGFPVLVPLADNFATLAARGGSDGVTRFEAAGRVRHVAEVAYVNGRSFGLQTKVGGEAPLAALIDIEGVDVGPTAGPADVAGTVTIPRLPGEFDLCLRASGLDLDDVSGHPATAPCENPAPFGDRVELTESPFAVVYRADAPIDVTADLAVHDHGADPASLLDDHRVSARVAARSIPREASVHLASVDGNLHALYAAAPPDEGAAEPSIEISATDADADLVCRDPRPPAPGDHAACIGARIVGAPTSAQVDVVPGATTENIVVDTDARIDVRDIDLSVVAAPEDGGEPVVLLADADIRGLPRRVVGTVVDGEITFEATPPLASFDATVQNFVAPDPLPPPAPQRAGLPDPEGFDTLTLVGRDDIFRATAHLTSLAGAGIRDGRDGARLIDLRFGRDKNIRAYLDVAGQDVAVLGDVTLLEVPAGVRLCVRGEPEGGGTSLGSFCESSAARAGVFEVEAEPRDGDARLDVYGYFRLAQAAGGDVFSGRVDLQDIPAVVRGELSGGGGQPSGVDIALFERVDDGDDDSGEDDELVPAGIGRIAAHAATFDIADHGYLNPPFVVRTRGDSVFGALTVPGTQHVGLAVDEQDIEARLLIGPPADGDAGSRLRRLLYRESACAAPAGRSDYPQYPVPDPGPGDVVTEPGGGGEPAVAPDETCVRVELEPVGDEPDELALGLALSKGGKDLALRHGLLSDVPEWLQLTLSDRPTVFETVDGHPFLPRCPTVAEPPATVRCATPMIRFDTEAGDATLAGVLELGTPDDLDELDGVGARAPDLPDLDAPPTESRWDDDWDDDPHGLRAAIAETDEGETVVRLGFRVPLPDSLTFQQPQSWSDEVAEQAGGDQDEVFYAARDIGLAYAARRYGTALPSLGRLAVVRRAADGSELVATDGGERDAAVTGGADGDGDPTATIRTPLGIPSELDVRVHLRDNKHLGRNLVQVDGAVNAPTDLRARLFPIPGELDPTVDLGVVNLPARTAATGDGPSFRVQAELIGSPKSVVGEEAVFDPDNRAVVRRLGAALDLAPDPDRPARLVKAVARFDKGQGFQVQAFDDVGGGGPPSALVSGDLHVSLDPLNVKLKQNLKGPFYFKLDLRSSLDLFVVLDRVSDVRVRAGGPHVLITNRDHPGVAERSIHLLPILDLDTLDADLSVDLWPFDIDFFGVRYLDLSDEPVPLDYEECGARSLLQGVGDLLAVPGFFLVQTFNLFGLDISYREALEVEAGGSKDAVIVPEAEVDERFFVDIVDIPIPLPFVGGELANIFDGFACRSAVEDMALIDGDEVHPADTLDLQGHPVPGVPVDFEPPASMGDRPAEPLVVAEGDDPLLLCGSHAYSTIDVSGEIRVTTVAGEGCEAGSTGELVLQAEQIRVHPSGRIRVGPGGLELHARTIVIDGVVDADESDGPIRLDASQSLVVSAGGVVQANGVESLMPEDADGDDLGTEATGNSGGGHGAAGGDGATGSGGSAYGNDNPRSLGAENGAPGNRDDGGYGFGWGGGVIVLTAAGVVEVAGTVRANGGDAFGDCDENDTLGYGGGAGGTVVLAAPEVRITGAVRARGGNGSSGPDGGGGGGGAGRIKVLSPLVPDGLPPAPRGGDGGSACGNEDAEPGKDGGDASEVLWDDRPQSRAVVVRDEPRVEAAEPFAEFWVSEDPGHGSGDHDLEVDADAAGGPSGSTEDAALVVCGVWLSPDIIFDDRDGDGTPDGPPTAIDFEPFMPNVARNEPDLPCGAHLSGLSVEVPRQMTARSVAAGEAVLADVALGDMDEFCNDDERDAGCPEGYWGVWTRVVTEDLRMEALPDQPDVIVGVDNTDPFVAGLALSDAGGDVVDREFPFEQLFTADNQVGFDVESSDQDTGAPRLSGVAGLSCVEITGLDGDRYGFECRHGDNRYTLRSQGDGLRTLQIEVTDRAGNANDPTDFAPSTLVTVDRTAPDAGIFLPPSPDGRNGWFLEPPVFRLWWLTDPDNSDGWPGVGIGEPGAERPRFRYRWDDFGEEACGDTPEEGLGVTCSVLDAPPLGVHDLHFTAVDALGNRLPAAADDPTTPVMEVVEDVKIDGEPPTSSLHTVPRRPDGDNEWFVTEPMVVIAAADQLGGSGLTAGPTEEPVAGVYYRTVGPDGTSAELPYTEPFVLGAGSHQVCWRAVDVAGNADVGVAGEEPTLEELAAAGHCKSFDVDADDPDVSATVAPVADGGGGWWLTAPTVDAAASDAAPGSGLAEHLIAVDEGPFVPYAGPVALGAGEHVVWTYAIDRAGRRSPIVEQLVGVDQSTPAVEARVVPGAPARGGWWRRGTTVVLRATDGAEASGVVALERRVDGGPYLPYTGPFTLPAGQHTVDYRARDAAGHATAGSLPVLVDDGAPLARATVADPTVWHRLLGPATARLHFEVGDSHSPTVRVTVLVIGAGGNVLRRLDAGTLAVAPAGPTAGFATWDGRDSAGQRVLGTVHHRVVVVDQAGNRAQSSESRPLQIVLL